MGKVSLFFLLCFGLLHGASYRDSGVDIAAGDELVSRIKPFAQMTARPGSNAALGGFGGLFDLAQVDYKDPILVSTTDGVGTKLKIAQALHKHDTIGIDLVAMSVNDLIVQGAQPLFFLDYFATGVLNIEEASIVIKGISEACKISDCALSGGETAEMPGMYSKGEYDLAGFAVGIAERSHLLPKLDEIKSGDIVLGLASSGVHSNGFSLIRYLLEEKKIDLLAAPPFPSSHKTIGDVLLDPTKIYVRSLLPLIKGNLIKALAHITGGGLLENIPRVLPDLVAVELNATQWEIPPVFHWIAQMGNVEEEEMQRTFNLGIGMVLIVAPENVSIVQRLLKQSGEKVFIIGKTIPLIRGAPQVQIKGKMFGAMSRPSEKTSATGFGWCCPAPDS